MRIRSIASQSDVTAGHFKRHWALGVLLLAFLTTCAQARDQGYYPVQELLVTGKTIVGEDIQYPTTGVPKITVAVVTVARRPRCLSPPPGAVSRLHSGRRTHCRLRPEGCENVSPGRRTGRGDECAASRHESWQWHGQAAGRVYRCRRFRQCCAGEITYAFP